MGSQNIQLGFVLGRDNALSIAEIFAVLARNKVTSKVIFYKDDILILELNNDAAQKLSINQFGGVIKLFEIIDISTDIADLKAKIIEQLPAEPEKRINYGLSGYGKLNKKLIQNLGYEIKEDLVNNGLKARFVTARSMDLSSVIVTENKLLERGVEAILIKNDESLILGKTIAVQDYKAYSKRDYGRPFRDDKNGMLPPKLAQILVNLAAKPLDATIYDPFCGSGTILQEALLLGYKNVIGSDLVEKNVEDTRKNLKWLGFDAEIFVSDVLNPVLKTKVDAIVAEGFLGDPVRRGKDKAAIDAAELSNFYLKALTNLRSQLNDDGRIVLAIPFFIVGREYFYLPILDKLSEIGLELVKPNLGNTNIKLFGRGNLTYSRPDQFVGREILILKKS